MDETHHPQRRTTDPGYDPAANTAPPLPSDDLVGQAVERAAEKVAAVATPAGPPVMNRTEAFVAVGILIIINLANLWVAIESRQDMRAHRTDFKTVCELLVQQHPPGASADRLALALAECLH